MFLEHVIYRYYLFFKSTILKRKEYLDRHYETFLLYLYLEANYMDYIEIIIYENA